MKRTTRMIAAALTILCAVGTTAHAKGTYDRVPLKTTAIAVEPSLAKALDDLRGAVSRKDRKAIYKMLSPRFEVLRDLGGSTNPKMSAKKKFDALMPGWDDLPAMASVTSWGPEQPGSKHVCGPAPLTGADEEAVMKAAKMRDGSDDSAYYEWLYATAPTEVYEKPDAASKKMTDLGTEAIRAIGGDDKWTQVALPSGAQGYVKADGLYALLHSRLCFAKVKGKWLISGYVGGGD